MKPLATPTPPAWAHHVLRRPGPLLLDHLQCEMKAATTALSLISKNPQLPALIVPLLDVADEELAHYRTIHELVVKRRYREIATNGTEYTVIRNLRTTNVMQSPRWRVPPDRYFMMGDNRDNSRDSRLWNNPYVAPEQVKGKAFRVHWSWVVGGGQSAERGFIADFVNTVWRVVSFQIEEVRWGRIGRKVDGAAD